MSRYAIAGGHTVLINGYSTSASEIHNELEKDRIIKDFVIEYLQLDGNEVFDCSTPFNIVDSQSGDLNYKVGEVNKYNVDLAVDIHLNASDNSLAEGVETYVHTLGNSSTDFAIRVNNNLVSLGFKDRGIKENSGLAFLRNTNCKAILVECYFCSNSSDCSLADNIGMEIIGKMIAEGIVGHEINKSEEPSEPTLDMSRLPLDFNEQFYRYANPDVNQKIIENVFPNGMTHYCLYGYQDAPSRIYKPCLPKDWSSDGYMSLNEDIRQAVENKSIPSPSWHWLVQGWMENMANPNDRKYKDNNELPIFYGEAHQEIPTPVITEPVDEVEEIKTPIMGNAILSAEQMVTFLLKNNPQPKLNGMNPLEFCKIYLEEGEIEGVRGDIAFAQSVHECGFFSFQGIVLPDQCNYSGIGATNPIPSHTVVYGDTLENLAKKYYTKVDLIKTLNNIESNELTIGVVLQLPPPLGKGNWFADQSTGIKAQIQHLKCYSSTEPLNNECVDPRFNLVTRGIAPYITDLGGKWASPGYNTNQYSSFEEACKAKQTYGQMIISVYDRMASTEVDEDLIKSLQPVVEVPQEPIEDNTNNNETINFQNKINLVINELETLKVKIDTIITNLK
jgi:LysM repeat protein